MLFCSHKSGFFSILDSMELTALPKNKAPAYDVVSQGSKFTAETDVNSIQSCCGKYKVLLSYEMNSRVPFCFRLAHSPDSKKE